jgi:predicted transcriptional regulator
MRNKTATFRFDDRDHEILNNLAKVRGQNKTQVLKRMLREEEVREAERGKISRELDSFIQKRLSEIASDRNADLAEGIEE